jgi:hypothetical protein
MFNEAELQVGNAVCRFRKHDVFQATHSSAIANTLLSPELLDTLGKLPLLCFCSWLMTDWL